MSMDPSSMNGIQMGNQSVFDNSFQDLTAFPYSHPIPSNPNGNGEEHCPEDCDFSDTVLGYISQILMEEDIEDKTCMLQHSNLDLQATEQSFYNVLANNYPPSPEPNRAFLSRNDTSFGNCSTSTGYIDDNRWISNLSYSLFPPQCISVASNGSSNSVISSTDSPSSMIQFGDCWNIENQPVLQFMKGIEEANRFLPNGDDLFRNIAVNRSVIGEVIVKEEGKEGGEFSPSWRRGRKNPHGEDGFHENERSSKQPDVYVDCDMEEHVIDKLLLYTAGEGQKDFSDLCESLKNASIKSEPNAQPKGSNGGKRRGKKRQEKKEVVDLRTLLIYCAQAVAADDNRRANELLRRVRLHSSPFGDGNQRLAHCFADGLQARLAGTGSHIYQGIVSKRTSAANVLKAYHLYLAACPFRKLTNFVSNRTILDVASHSMRLHIIDFGILYGFQWPTLIQRLSWISGGPPKLRITGIEFPQPGFRPAERVEETGRRLAIYAKKFNVPFEYIAIAKRWETIKPEELKIDREEVLFVTCFYRAKNLLDETVVVDSAKDIVIRLVKKINPKIFIHGVVNGAYSAPFFVTRFREALYHFSSLFDMLDSIIPRDDIERMLIEKEIIGREALNVVACEGWERVERPETYKQWQVRCMKSGFVQLPFDREIVKVATRKVRNLYHKDFLIDEDGRWLLQGWKGRVIYTLSAWRPTQEA